MASINNAVVAIGRAGADHVITQPVFDPKQLLRSIEEIKKRKIKLKM